MRSKWMPISFLLVVCLAVSLTSDAKTRNAAADSTPLRAAGKDAKTIVADYINAIGGMDAVKKINSTSSTGNLSVQGMSLPVTQKRMSPNKTMQTVSMNGTTVGKTVFNGTKGYSEQMGNRTDMSEDDMADMKMQASIVPQLDYLTNGAYKMLVQGIDTINGADAYKVLVTMPSGKTDTEYYAVASKLLVEQVIGRTMGGQSVMATYQFSDYKKAGDVLLPYKLNLMMASGAINQSIDIVLTDIKVNEDVADADFE